MAKAENPRAAKAAPSSSKKATQSVAGPDLFVAAAEAARQEAARRWRNAPWGLRNARFKAFQEATQAALRASLEARK